MKALIKTLKYISAALHIRDQDVCELSTGWQDFHDYQDSNDRPWHFQELECKRCGKKFYI